MLRCCQRHSVCMRSRCTRPELQPTCGRLCSRRWLLLLLFPATASARSGLGRFLHRSCLGFCGRNKEGYKVSERAYKSACHSTRRCTHPQAVPMPTHLQAPQQQVPRRQPASCPCRGWRRAAPAWQAPPPPHRPLQSGRARQRRCCVGHRARSCTPTKHAGAAVGSPAVRPTHLSAPPWAPPSVAACGRAAPGQPAWLPRWPAPAPLPQRAPAQAPRAAAAPPFCRAPYGRGEARQAAGRGQQSGQE